MKNVKFIKESIMSRFVFLESFNIDVGIRRGFRVRDI